MANPNITSAPLTAAVLNHPRAEKARVRNDLRTSRAGTIDLAAARAKANDCRANAATVEWLTKLLRSAERGYIFGIAFTVDAINQAGERRWISGMDGCIADKRHEAAVEVLRAAFRVDKEAKRAELFLEACGSLAPLG